MGGRRGWGIDWQISNINNNNNNKQQQPINKQTKEANKVRNNQNSDQKKIFFVCFCVFVLFAKPEPASSSKAEYERKGIIKVIKNKMSRVLSTPLPNNLVSKYDFNKSLLYNL